MRVSDIDVLRRYAHHFQPEIPRFREGKYIQVVVLRETKSHTIFTTEGQNLHVERVPAGVKNSEPIDRVVMYKRKQIAPERRTGKAMLRQFELCPPENIESKDGKILMLKSECQIVGQACGVCPDCILYGFVNTSSERAGSQRSRVLTDSGFVVRSLSQVLRSIKLNAISETTDGSVGQGAYSRRENLIPEVFLPTVETLVDVTQDEFVYVMGNILKTTRYGAESGREGFVRNHIVGVYFSDVELFSNLEMTQTYYDILSADGTMPDTLSLQDFTDNFVPMANEAIRKSIGRIDMLTDDEIQELLHDINIIYSDKRYLTEFLSNLSMMSVAYANQYRRGNHEKTSNVRNQKHQSVAV